ncbi:MAG: DUF305 domain-containing protein [Gemmatimonadales bacterium]|jgi:uncharacterized protein (DUF305 family)
MTLNPTSILAAALIAAVFAAGCSTAAPAAGTAPGPSSVSRSEQVYIAQARADSLRHPYVEADVEFMYNMVGHHAQAITMSQWAPTHGASAAVQRLASRIINAQRDEIATMQTWLRDRQKPVPVPAEHGGPMQMMMGGELMEHMLMPGMLTDAQMQQLDAARGEEFDRLFLLDMIQHHRGAVSMVKDLFGSYGAAQDELVFKFANDVNVDQTTEIARMEKMLVALTVGVAP